MTKTICIEYGYYKSSATLLLYNLQTEKNDIIRLNINKNEQIIDTQILLTNSQIKKLKDHYPLDYHYLSTLGTMEIGHHLKTNDDTQLFSQFRLPPQYFDTLYDKSEEIIENHMTRGKLMACFIFAFVDNILKYNHDYLDENDRKDLIILIGSLNDKHWGSDEAVEKYSNLVKRATGVNDVQIILI